MALELTDEFRITVDNASDWLQYETRYKVLVSRYHCRGISNLRSHLRTGHSGTTSEKEAVVRKHLHLETLRPTTVQLPPPLQATIKSLRRPRDAFICDEEECGYMTISRDGIRKHCNRKHDWRSTKEDREH
jgi:hypothetical protein